MRRFPVPSSPFTVLAPFTWRERPGVRVERGFAKVQADAGHEGKPGTGN